MARWQDGKMVRWRVIWQYARHHIAQPRGAHDAHHKVGRLEPAAPRLAQLEAHGAHCEQQATHAHELEGGEEAGPRRTHPRPALLPRLHPRPSRGGRDGRFLLQAQLALLRTALLPLAHHRAHQAAEQPHATHAEQRGDRAPHLGDRPDVTKADGCERGRREVERVVNWPPLGRCQDESDDADHADQRRGHAPREDTRRAAWRLDGRRRHQHGH
eukprot:scaffold25039_cov69-Phaeocystis_antarctica.AAC.2